MTRFFGLSPILFFLLFSLSYGGSNKLDGAILVKENCAECHADDGNGTSDQDGNIPIIAGFSSFLIYDTLIQFKEGDRKASEIKNEDGLLTDMRKISKKLSEDEIVAISLFLGKQRFKPANQKYNAQLATLGKQLHRDLCDNCHTDLGTSSKDDAPILSGQWKAYLDNKFKAITNFEFGVSRKMRRKFKKLTPEDQKAIIEFYISAKPKEVPQ